MAEQTGWTNTQLYSHEFVNCAGSVLFRRPRPTPHIAASPGSDIAINGSSSRSGLQLCILHHLAKGEWLLPKGRQDRGESLATAAVRETHEETGFACALLPLDMTTRAPEPGADTKDAPRAVHACTEPFSVSIREYAARNVKLVWWFVTLVREDGVDGNGLEWTNGTQMRHENFEPWMCDVDVDVRDEGALDAAVARLTYTTDREIVKKALRLVAQTYPEWFTRGRK